VALPPIDVALTGAKKLASGVEEGVDIAGRTVLKASSARLRDLLEAAAMQGLVAAVQHYALIDASRRTPPARVRRGLFRLWCCGAIVWPFCLVWIALSDRHFRFEGVEWVPVVLALAVPPIVVLLIATAAIKLGVWVWNGFRGGP